MPVGLEGQGGVARALAAVGERLAHAGEPCAIVVLGGAAINPLGVVDRATRDVDVLARQAPDGKTIEPPDPLPAALLDAIAAVAHDLGLESNWMNTTVADQWRFGLPPGLEERIEWRAFGGLAVGIVARRDLVFFKLYAAADDTGPASVHVKDLLALRPSDEDLDLAADWVSEQDPSPEFRSTVAKVVAYARRTLR